MTQQGANDNPSYLVRQQIVLGKTTAGANGTSLITQFPTSNMRIRNVSAIVTASGSSSTTGAEIIILCIGTCTSWGIGGTGTGSLGTATSTLGTIAFGTSSLLSVGTSGDCNTTVNAGAILCFKNGTDATEVVQVSLEAHIDNQSGWTAP